MKSAAVDRERVCAEEILGLWKDYRASGDRRIRDRLVLTFAPMVKYIVYKKIREIPEHLEVEDFISCGLEALIHSIDRYDPEKGATLEQYAWTRIHGAVLDELRRHDWAPRSLRRSEREIGRARTQFTTLHGRRPSSDELAVAMEVTPKALRATLDDIATCDVGSLNVFVASEDDASIERIDTLASRDREADPEHATALADGKERFREVFRRMPERERTVAILLYVNNLTLREVGEVLGVSESRVCQIHSQFRRDLRALLSGHAELFHEVV